MDKLIFNDKPQKELPYMKLARSLIGLKEIRGKKHNPQIVGMLEYVSSVEGNTKAWWREDETPWCFTPETEVLTKRGYVRFDELDKNSDQILQVHDDLSFSYSSIWNKVEKTYNGSLYAFKYNNWNKQLMFKCDPLHKMYVVKSTNSSDITEGDYTRKFDNCFKLFPSSETSTTNYNFYKFTDSVEEADKDLYIHRVKKKTDIYLKLLACFIADSVFFASTKEYLGYFEDETLKKKLYEQATKPFNEWIKNPFLGDTSFAVDSDKEENILKYTILNFLDTAPTLLNVEKEFKSLLKELSKNDFLSFIYFYEVYCNGFLLNTNKEFNPHDLGIYTSSINIVKAIKEAAEEHGFKVTIYFKDFNKAFSNYFTEEELTDNDDLLLGINRSTDDSRKAFHGFDISNLLNKDENIPIFKLCIQNKNSAFIRASEYTYEQENYSGKLHCVSVPSGKIVVKTTSGEGVVVGNCGTFVAYCLTKNGYELPKHWYRARAYRSLEPSHKLEEGDILVFTRSGGGHVAFSTGVETDTHIEGLSGNHRNRVDIAMYPKDTLLGIYKPKLKGT